MSHPKKIASLTLFKPQTSDSEYSYLLLDNASYDELGNSPTTGSLVRVSIPVDGPASGDIVIYCQIKQSTTTCSNNGLTEWDTKTINAIKTDTLTFSDTSFEGVVVPNVLVYKSTNLGLDSRVSLQPKQIKDLTKLEDNTYGTLYTLTNSIDNTTFLKTRALFLETHDHSYFAYHLNITPYAEKMLTPQWKDESIQSQAFSQNILPGCGGGMLSAVPIFTGDVSTKVQVALSSTRVPLYQLTTTDAAVDLYSIYKIGREGYDSTMLSKEAFVSKNDSYLLYQDELGDWQVFFSDAYAPPVECGKPVIYLYPTSPTQVHVSVGASITQSVPTYPQSGWTVMSYPNGTLTYQNQQYPNLFWEGKGDGVYPNLRNQGVVVAKDNLISTLTQQLVSLGLTAPERHDFLEFWVPKLPTTSYTRLTWLGTREMDQLAPLLITPKPNTQIRIFLEFEGLDHQIDLIPQQLTSRERKGFTVVEWGGLLIGQH